MPRADSTRADALDALSFVDPGSDRDTWVRVLMAAKAAGLDEADAIAWSATAPNFAGERDVQGVWRSIRAEGGIGPGSLFHMAMAAGWRRAPGGSGDRQRDAPPDGSRVAPRVTAAEVWSKCGPASTAHGYIARKSGAPAGLRVVDRSLRIAGHDVRGWLAVPVRNVAGELLSLQFIPPDPGPKLNLPGHRMSGMFVVGDLHPQGVAYVVEGLGQAWACWRATGSAAVVTFGVSRTTEVAKLLRDAYPALRLVIVPDRGKEPDAERAASQVDGEWVAMPTAVPDNFDASDYAEAEGAEALAMLLEQAQTAPERFTVLTADELLSMAPQRWLVRDILPTQGIAAVFGPSGSAKTFLVLDLMVAIAEGECWFGHATRQSTVLYCALEGESGIGKRMQAWARRHGRPLPTRARFMVQPLDLRADARELAACIARAGGAQVVFIDTMNQAAPGMDENDSAEMGRVIQAARELQRSTAGLVVLVAHSGKDESRGLRGHSSLRAALDAALEVRRSATAREWRTYKVKDGRDDESHAFALETVDLGTDSDGVPTSSCVIVPGPRAAGVTPQSRRRQGENQRTVLRALGELIRGSPSRADDGTLFVDYEAAIDAIAPQLACERHRRVERTKSVLAGLIAAGLVEQRDGRLSLR